MRAWEALARTTQACTAQAQSTGRRTPAMSTTLTSGRRTIWANGVDDKPGAAAMPLPTSAA